MVHQFSKLLLAAVVFSAINKISGMLEVALKQCPDFSSVSPVHVGNIQTAMQGNIIELKISAIIVVDTISKVMVKVTYETCRDIGRQYICSKNKTVQYDDLCDHSEDVLQPWSSLFETVHNDLTCPIVPGIYDYHRAFYYDESLARLASVPDLYRASITAYTQGPAHLVSGGTNKDHKSKIHATIYTN